MTVVRALVQHLCVVLVLTGIVRLIIIADAQDLADIEGFSNDSPFIIEPKLENIRVKEGTPISLKCVGHPANHTIWEYKECELPYKGIVCNLHDLTDITSRGTRDSWKRRGNRQRLEIGSTKKNHSGVYRCIEKGVVRKSIIIEVVGTESYEGPPPRVQSLLASNVTGQWNMEFTIQCNVSSSVPPTIIWFKKCYGSKCDIKYADICYCHLNMAASSYNIGNTYISKINIFNARDIDSGLYACLAVTEYGKDYRNVTINVPEQGGGRFGGSAFPVLFLVPLTLVVVPVIVWLCYSRRRKKKMREMLAIGAQQRQQQALLKPSRSRMSRQVV